MLESCHTAACAGLGNRFVPAVSAENRAAFVHPRCPVPVGAHRVPVDRRMQRRRRDRAPVAGADGGADHARGRRASADLDPSDRQPARRRRSALRRAIPVLPCDRSGPSGLASLALIVDGTPHAEQLIDPHDTRCRTPYTFPVPCPTEQAGTIAFDTARLTNGEHTIRLSVRDASGNAVESESHRIRHAKRQPAERHFREPATRGRVSGSRAAGAGHTGRTVPVWRAHAVRRRGARRAAQRDRRRDGRRHGAADAHRRGLAASRFGGHRRPRPLPRRAPAGPVARCAGGLPGVHARFPLRGDGRRAAACAGRRAPRRVAAARAQRQRHHVPRTGRRR